MSEWYILEGRDIRPVADFIDYYRWRNAIDKDGPRAALRVAADDVNDVHVSTVFLGLNHAWGDGPPLVFETMTFDHRDSKTCDEYQWRYSTLDEAEAGHRAIVEAIREGRELPD